MASWSLAVHEKACRSVLHDIRNAAGLCGNERQPGSVAFEDRAGHAVQIGAGQVNVDRIVQVGDLTVGNSPDEGRITQTNSRANASRVGREIPS